MIKFSYAIALWAHKNDISKSNINMNFDMNKSQWMTQSEEN